MPRHVHISADFDAWRDAARRLIASNVAPADVTWSDDRQPPTLLGAEDPLPEVAPASFNVPRDFVETARLVACHRDDSRWPLLYHALHRLVNGEPHLLSLASDDDVIALDTMARSVRRDRHKMTAFVRFRKIQDDQGDHYVAYHEPEHYIVRLTAPFFRERFASMRWTILTPDDSVSWDGNQLVFAPGADRSAAPREDDHEALWLTYYKSIFNPARVKVGAMLKEMPRKYWSTMPETRLIPELLAGANRRTSDFIAKGKRDEADSPCAPGQPMPADRAPAILSLSQLHAEMRSCNVCPWSCRSTQTVPGEGSHEAKIVFVGEQPGDVEDLQGRPFVGPAGQLLERVMQEVGLDRTKVYLTNAVKHFKFEPRGKRRIHQTPDARDVRFCRPWLVRELEIIKPSMLVCLGATAARSLLGAGFRITKSRGQVIQSEWAPWTMATYHPSALLRMPDDAKPAAERDFRSDLEQVARAMVS